MPQISVDAAIERIKSGGMVIIVDDEDRENEGDVAMAAEMATPDAINFMVTHARGLVVVPMLGERLEQLRLPLMVQRNTDRMRTAFTVSVDAVNGTTTGISAQDRAATIMALVHLETRPDDLARPGHVFPLQYTEGGVLVRAGHTEAIIDLVRLAGLSPAGVLCEMLAGDGRSARLPDLEKVSSEHGLGIVSVADIIAYRNEHENLVERVAGVPTPDQVRRLQSDLFQEPRGQGRPHRPCDGRRRPRRASSRQGAQRMPHRGRLQEPAVRLRRAEGSSHGGHRERGQGHLPLP